MMITKIEITKTFDEGLLKAIVSVVINGFYNFWDIQIIQGLSRLFVAMPNSYEEEKLFSINEVETYPEERQDFERCIVDAYNKYVEANKAYTDYLNQYTVYEISKIKRSGFMSISDIKVKKISNNNNLKALVSVKLDDCIVINDIQIIQSEDRLLVVMPGTESESGLFHDIVNPVYYNAREDFESQIIDAYNNTDDDNTSIDDIPEYIEVLSNVIIHDLKITEVHLNKMYLNKDIKAIVSVTFNNYLTVHDIKVIGVDERLHVAMPSCKDENGDLKDIVHLVYLDSREQLQRIILDKYLELYKDMYIKQLHLKTE